MQAHNLTNQISRTGTEFQARIKWNENDVGIWDNRCVVSIYHLVQTVIDSSLMVHPASRWKFRLVSGFSLTSNFVLNWDGLSSWPHTRHAIRVMAVAETPLSVEDAAAAGIQVDSREAAEYKRRGWDLIETAN